MGMTNKELYICACNYAIQQIIKTGSNQLTIIDSDEMIDVPWEEVLFWLEEEYKTGNGENGVEIMPSVTPQEPFMATPCISSKVCEHDRMITLNKIRAEIEQITDTMGVSYNQYVSKIDVLQILDKYKADRSEEDEDSN